MHLNSLSDILPLMKLRATQMYITQSQVSEISPYCLNNAVLGHCDGCLMLSEDQFGFVQQLHVVIGSFVLRTFIDILWRLSEIKLARGACRLRKNSNSHSY